MPIVPCGTDCDDNLHPVSFDDCFPQFKAGRIDNLYITNRGFPMADWTDPVEWGNRLDNTAPNQNSIIELCVIGGKGAESNIQELEKDLKWVGRKTHTLNFTVNQINAENIGWLETIECNGNYLLLGYATSSGLLFGTPDGIEVFIDANLVVPESDEEVINITGTATWKSLQTECFIDKPF